MGLAFEALPATNPSEPYADGLLDGRYRFVKRMGGGGMGEVYEVEHARLKRLFALKLLRVELSGERDLVARFDREARAVAALHSEHVVSIVDSGSLADGRPYLVMERLVGQDLKQVLSGVTELPVARAVNIGIDICLGLHAAHSAGLVHRDLKPENVFVTRGDDQRERCKLLDFGVVKLAEQDQTRPGVLLGTARYMAPEQVTSGERVTPAVDLFALGVILYRCLSGQHPFAADAVERVLFRILHDTPPPLPAHVPKGLARLIEQAMAKQASDRPASALDFARALTRFTHGARNVDGAVGCYVNTDVVDADGGVTHVEATPVIPGEALVAPRAKRHLGAWVATGALLLVAALGVERLLRGAHEPPPATRTTSVPGPTPPPAAAPAPERTPPLPEPAPPASASAPPLAARAPAAALGGAAPSSVAPSAPAKPVAPVPSAAAPAPSAAVPSLNWFDPRNPYAQ